MRIIKPTKSIGNFVCTWCAESFETRGDLLQHRLLNPDCANNQNVSNQTQSKYLSAGNAKTVEGEKVLQRVRGGNCDHTTYQAIVNDQDELIAMQCTYCYTYFPVPQPGD